MNARRFRCISLEYFDNIDLKFHKKRTTGVIQLWGIRNVNSSSAFALQIGKALLHKGVTYYNT